MIYESSNTKIIGMSAAVPEGYIDNDVIAKGDKALERLVRMTGIHHRHVIDLSKHRLVDYAVVAANDAIYNSGISKNNIRYIIYCNQHPEFYAPSTAFYIQKELGVEKNCMVFDVNLGCSGFLAGLQMASSLISNQKIGECAVLINAECLSDVKRDNENDEFLFGDAATAVVVMKTESNCGHYVSEYFSDGSRYKSIFQEKSDSPCIMDGQGVFEFSVFEVSEYIKSFLNTFGLTDDDIDYIAFHQAQKFIIDHVAANAKLSKKKLLYSLDEYANTSGASVPLSICKNEGILKNCGRYLLSGFGVGLAWGVAYLEIERKYIFGIKEI